MKSLLTIALTLALFTIVPNVSAVDTDCSFNEEVDDLEVCGVNLLSPSLCTEENNSSTRSERCYVAVNGGTACVNQSSTEYKGSGFVTGQATLCANGSKACTYYQGISYYDETCYYHGYGTTAQCVMEETYEDYWDPSQSTSSAICVYP